jgi:hypothetical protein
MRTAQGKVSSFLMVEERRFPLRAVMTLGTSSYVAFGELLSMDILMAVLALGRGGPEIGVEQFGLKVRGLVAIDAGRSAVRAHQGEFCG